MSQESASRSGSSCGRRFIPAKAGRLRALFLAFFALGSLFLSSCGPSTASFPSTPTLAQVEERLDGLSFPQFVDAAYDLYVLRYPQTAMTLGVAQDLGIRSRRLDSFAPGYEDQTTAIQAAILGRLREFRRASLSSDEKVAYDVCEWMWAGGAARDALPQFRYAIFPGETSPDVALAAFFAQFRIVSEEDADDYIACLHEVPRQADQLRSRIEAEAEAGTFLPYGALQLAVLQLDELRALMTSQKSEWLPPRYVGTNHPLFIPLRDALPRIESMPRDERSKKVVAVGKYVASSIMPALERLYQSAATILKVGTPTTPGWGEASGGRSAYAVLVRGETGADVVPAEIRRRASAAMQSLRAEIADLAPRLGLAPSATLPEIWEVVQARLADDVARCGLADGEELAVLSRAWQTMFRTSSLSQGGAGEDAPGSLLLYSEAVPWACGAPDPFAGFLNGFRLYLLDQVGRSAITECPALALYARLSLYEAAADAVLDTGIHVLGWSQQDAQREYAGMVEAMGSVTRVSWGHWRARLETYEITESVAFADVAMASGTPGRAAAPFAVWSEIVRMRDEAKPSAAWSEAAFREVLVRYGALPIAVAEKLVDAAFPG